MFFIFTYYLPEAGNSVWGVLFLPAAKPTGHRTVRVVVVGGDYFEVMTLKLTLSQGQLFLVEITFIFPLCPVLPP